VYTLEIDDNVDKEFRKLAKKDKKQLEAVNKKIEQILNDPSQFKPLKYPLEGLRRVHVGPFVIIYEVFEDAQTVRILKYSHHDKAYE
jgi:YafQ family addiction module toxin component